MGRERAVAGWDEADYIERAFEFEYGERPALVARAQVADRTTWHVLLPTRDGEDRVLLASAGVNVAAEGCGDAAERLLERMIGTFRPATAPPDA